jgi:hypothetical protein
MSTYKLVGGFTVIQTYKGRQIDVTQKVSVYFNLHLKVWSIKQGSLVVAHAEEITLTNVTTKIYESGRLRVIQERKKNVHSYLVGYITESDVEPKKGLYYNPYKVSSFVDADTMAPVHAAQVVRLNSDRSVNYN